MKAVRPAKGLAAFSSSGEKPKRSKGMKMKLDEKGNVVVEGGVPYIKTPKICYLFLLMILGYNYCEF